MSGISEGANRPSGHMDGPQKEGPSETATELGNDPVLQWNTVYLCDTTHQMTQLFSEVRYETNQDVCHYKDDRAH